MVELMAIEPRKILGLDQVTIAEGSVADLTVFDADVAWTVSEDDFVSHAKKMCIRDRTGTMRVTCNGATAYDDYASAGIAQNALNFDANSSDWQDKAEAIGFGLSLIHI